MSDLSRRSFITRLVPFCLGGSLATGWAAQTRRAPSPLGDSLEKIITDPEGSFYEPEYPVSEELESEPQFTSFDAEYAGFIAALDLRHIKPHELILPHRRTKSGVSNTLPPKELWKNMPPTLAVADEIRERLGAPLRAITSAYRSPAYNAKCPGSASRSQHIENSALDLIFDASPSQVFKVAHQLQRERFFRGGVGLYSGFVHIDTRGTNATW